MPAPVRRRPDCASAAKNGSCPARAQPDRINTRQRTSRQRGENDWIVGDVMLAGTEKAFGYLLDILRHAAVVAQWLINRFAEDRGAHHLERGFE